MRGKKKGPTANRQPARKKRNLELLLQEAMPSPLPEVELRYP
jgi:hypothetical protein